MDDVAAGLIGGIGGGLAGGFAAFGVAFMQRRWDRELARAERSASERSARQAALTRAVSDLWAGAVEAQLAANVIHLLPMRGPSRHHVVNALDRLPGIASTVTRTYTEIHLVADDSELVELARRVLGSVEHVAAIATGRRFGELSTALAELNDVLVNLRQITRELADLPQIPEPVALTHDNQPIADGCVAPRSTEANSKRHLQRVSAVVAVGTVAIMLWRRRSRTATQP